MDISSRPRSPSPGMSAHRVSIGDKLAGPNSATQAELKMAATSLACLTGATTDLSEVAGKSGSRPASPTLGTDALRSNELKSESVVDLETASDLLEELTDKARMVRNMRTIGPEQLATYHATAKTFVASLVGQPDQDLDPGDLEEFLDQLKDGVPEWKTSAEQLVSKAKDSPNPDTKVLENARGILALATQAGEALRTVLEQHGFTVPPVPTAAPQKMASLPDPVAARKEMQLAETRVDQLLAENPIWPQQVQEAKTALVNYFKQRVTVMQSEGKAVELQAMQNVVNHFAQDARPILMPKQLADLKIIYQDEAKKAIDKNSEATLLALKKDINQSAGRSPSSFSTELPMSEIVRRREIFAKAEKARTNGEDYEKTIAELDIYHDRINTGH